MMFRKRFARLFCAKYIDKLALNELKARAEPLRKVIRKDIELSGPISFARFMEISQTDPTHGYYMKQDVFNREGDFITSPEISDMFSEIIGVWITHFFQHTGYFFVDGTTNQKSVNILEFGPGRGTMMMNIIRTFAQLGVLKKIDFHFVEASPFNRKQQQDNIINELKAHGIYMVYDDVNQLEQEQKSEKNDPTVIISQSDRFYSEEEAEITINWYSTYEAYIAKNFQEVAVNSMSSSFERKPVMVLCHEFFDALPSFIFEYTDFGWVEKLVDIAMDVDTEHEFQWVHSEPFSKSVEKILNPNLIYTDKALKSEIKVGDRIEISPKSLVLANSISELISKIGGAMLTIDYGDNHAFSDSLRGISKHRFVKNHDLLDLPGEVDLSAYVNFLAIGEACQRVSQIKRPRMLTQGDFLNQMGLQQRAAILKEASGADPQIIESQVHRLTHPDEMGDIFKFMYVGLKSYGEVFPFINPNEKIY